MEHTALKELEQYQSRMRKAMETAGVCVFEMDLKECVCPFFENAEGVFHTSGEKIIAQINNLKCADPRNFWEACLRLFCHEEDVGVGRDGLEQVLAGKKAFYHARIKASPARCIWCKVDLAPLMEEGEVVGVMGVMTDVNAMYAETEQLERAVMLDEFTDLYAKNPCLDLIRSALRTHGDKQHALLLMDLDRFKHINDTYGHLVGDQVLLSVAKDQKGLFRSTDIVGRFGGDEFLVFMQNVKSRDAIRSKLELVIRPCGIPHPVTKSVGVAFYPEDGESLELLLERADKALYQAKKTRGAYVVYPKE